MTDRAVETARQILHKLICECGHVESDHLCVSDAERCLAPGCKCPKFEPVKFSIERSR